MGIDEPIDEHRADVIHAADHRVVSCYDRINDRSRISGRRKSRRGGYGIVSDGANTDPKVLDIYGGHINLSPLTE